MLQWIAKRHAKVSKIYQLEKDAHLLELRAIEKDLEIRNVQGLIAMAREDIKQDGLEVLQAGTDIKNLEESLPELQRLDRSTEKLKDLQKMLEAAEGKVARGEEYEGNLFELSDQVEAKANVASVHDEINAAKERIETYKSETQKREAEIKVLETDLAKPAQAGGLRAVKAECQARAQHLRTIAAELRKRA